MANMVYVLYEGDAWLSSSSLVPMGIFDELGYVLESARKLISERYSDEDKANDIFNELADYFQTSGYDVCYMIKKVELNILEEF